MKLLISALAMTALAAADSNPSWWNYASPDATALVGIQWDTLRQSPLAEALSAELSSSGSLGFPAVDCLLQARQVVISAPALLAMASGTFPAATLKEQALHSGLHAIKYRGVALWLPPKAADLGLAQISEQLLLVGSLKTLEAAVDNSLAESGRRYSPLLARAARFSHNADLWVVSSRLPDPLANRFVPIEGAAQSFEGSISLRNGLDAEGWLDAGTPNSAAALAEAIRQASSGFPAFARTLQVTEGAGKVALELQVTPEQLSAALRLDAEEEVAEAAKPVAAAPAAPAPAPKPQATAVPPTVVARVEPSAPLAPSAPPAAPAAKPLVIRILGLEEGPREIPFPAVP